MPSSPLRGKKQAAHLVRALGLTLDNRGCSAGGESNSPAEERCSSAPPCAVSLASPAARPALLRPRRLCPRCWCSESRYSESRKPSCDPACCLTPPAPQHFLVSLTNLNLFFVFLHTRVATACRRIPQERKGKGLPAPPQDRGARPMLARGRDALWKALRPCAWPAAGALAHQLPAGKDGSRSFGRHPKHDPRVVNAEKPVPR